MRILNYPPFPDEVRGEILAHLDTEITFLRQIQHLVLWHPAEISLVLRDSIFHPSRWTCFSARIGKVSVTFVTSHLV